MVATRNFIDNSPTTNFPAGLNSSDTTAVVSSLVGFPVVFPYFATIDLGQMTAEVISVTAAVGLTITMVRNANGQGAFAHLSTGTLNHTAVALDYREANTHHVATSNVHGVTSNVVGVNDVQTLTNKTISNGVLNSVSSSPAATLNVSGTGDGWRVVNAGVTVAKADVNGAVTAASLTTAGAANSATVTTTGAVVSGGALSTNSTMIAFGDVSSFTGNVKAVGTGAGVQAGTGGVSSTGPVTGTSFTASGNGVVAGVVTPKSYTNQAAAVAGAGTVAGTVVTLSAPAGGIVAGTFICNGTTYLPLNPGSVRFKATTKAATAVTANTNIPYVTIAEDTAGAWNSTNKNYVVAVAGTYTYSTQGKWSGTPASAGGQGIFVNGTAVANSPNAANVAFQGPSISGYLRLAVADTVAAQPTNAYTTQADTGDNNFLELVWLGY